jgi:hypothetical protein
MSRGDVNAALLLIGMIGLLGAVIYGILWAIA